MVAAIDELHPLEVRAIVHNAEVAATITAACLHSWDAQLKKDGFPAGAQGLPAGFLMELGAIGLLHLWEIEGLRNFLPADLPTAGEAVAELNRRAATTPQEFQTVAGAQLAPRVWQAWLDHFSWAAPSLLQADVVLGEADEDVLVESLAQLAWNHRHHAAGQSPQSE
jgi:hypothetical protein